jgi:diguanylate cyclase (GGDEF)-like protein
VIWITENARAVRDEFEKLIYYEGTVEDITELKNHSQLIEYQATHDVLTGLPNRALLKDRLHQAIGNADRSGSRLAVVFIDLDRFKDVNDTLGHQAGDSLLIAVSKRLHSCMRDSDTISRPGGDEFVLILSNLQNPDALNLTLERILAVTAQPYSIDQREFTVTSSIGISIYPDDGKDSEMLLRHADNAMYKAKAAGKNNFQFFTKDFNATLIERLNLGYHLRNANLDEEFILHYQPKYSATTLQITGIEALVRWESIHFGLVSPAKFIPIAEEIGLINQIGEWVIKNACRQCLATFRNTGLMLPVAVNVSPKQFYSGQLVRIIESALSETGLDPAFLEIEITEGLFIHEPINFIEVLKNLKAIGIKLSIDDFGTGYSSMGYLKHFPIDKLKIDQSFVIGLQEDPANQAILKAIVALGHNLGLEVIAEGVETEMEREFLVSIGYDELQGFLFSKPMKASELESYIHSQT